MRNAVSLSNLNNGFGDCRLVFPSILPFLPGIRLASFDGRPGYSPPRSIRSRCSHASLLIPGYGTAARCEQTHSRGLIASPAICGTSLNRYPPRGERNRGRRSSSPSQRRGFRGRDCAPRRERKRTGERLGDAGASRQAWRRNLMPSDRMQPPNPRHEIAPQSTRSLRSQRRVSRRAPSSR